MRAAAKGLEYLKKEKSRNAAHVVFSHFCRELNGMPAEDNDPAPEDVDDLEVFASFVGNDTESQDIHKSLTMERNGAWA